MSYTTPDFADQMIELLSAKGYVIYQGNGYVSMPVDEADEDLLDETPKDDDSYEKYDEQIDGYWFTWQHPSGKGDIEVGEAYDNELSAWAGAAEHFFANAEIPMDLGD